MLIRLQSELLLQKLKSGKSDGIFDFNSDCLINSSDELIFALTDLFKLFLITGTCS